MHQANVEELESGNCEAEALRVTLGMIGGRKAEGVVTAFVPQSPDVHLYSTDERESRRPWIIAGEQIAYVAFHRGGHRAPPDVPKVRGRLLKIHVVDGQTFVVEVEPTALLNPLGFFAIPREAASPYARIFFYAHGVGATEDARPLGEILVETGELDPRSLERGLELHERERKVRIGELLVETQNVDPSVVEEAVALQKRRGLRLGELLVEAGWVTEEQVEAALSEQKRRQGKRIGEVLREMGFITEEALARTLANKFLIPLVDLDAEGIDQTAAFEIPKEIIEKHGVLPIRSSPQSVTIAISDPLAVNATEEVRFKLRKRVKEVMVLPSQLKRYVTEHLARIESEELGHGLEDLLEQLSEEIVPEKDPTTIEEVSESDGMVIQLVNRIILDAYRAGASDIHIEPAGNDGPVRVRLRVDGECDVYQELPATLRKALLSRIKIMASLDISERRKPQDGKIRLHTSRGKLELRVATLPTANDNEDAVLRVLSLSRAMSIERLHLSERNQRELLALAQKSCGIVLVVGPTGSGKTTSLHAVLGLLNTAAKKIWTAEDPVEIVQPGLRQLQVQPKIGLTFANALRAFLRADPDVIMVGEMRDHETATIAVEASLTGHLVLSTLHTNSAPETITRLIDMGLDPFNFSDALLGVLAQRLTRSLCLECRESYHPSEKEVGELEAVYGRDRLISTLGSAMPDGLVLWRGRGCSACNDTGYKGRVALHELLVADDAIRLAISRKEPIERLREVSVASGMTTLLQDGIEKALSGITDIRQVMSVCSR